MIISSEQAEQAALMSCAEAMCAAARTAPKAKGVDHIVCCILTGEDMEALAREMERLSVELSYGFLARDAQNVRESQAVVLIGARYGQRGLGTGCSRCGFDGCAACAQAGAVCVYDPMDLGIALGAAAAVAAERHIDNRIMFSCGRAANALGLLEGAPLVMGIPLSVSGKSPFFDRKPKA